MKNKFVMLLIVLCFVFLQVGCQQNKSDSQIDPVAVTVNGQRVILHEIDTKYDTLIGRNLDEDIDFEVEKKIFALPLNDKENLHVPLNSTIEITFADSFDDITLYDHLLKNNGTSYFNRMITEHKLVLENNKATLELTQHMSALLSSNSKFLENGSIRGFRLVLRSGDDVKEYAFVIYVE